MCGYETQDLPVSYEVFTSNILTDWLSIYCLLQDAEAAKRIWTGGCISAVEHLLYGNLYIIAGVATGVAFAQVFLVSRYFSG